MSKQIKVQLTCPNCRTKFDTSLYRSIWVEVPENRRLIFEDKINQVTCPKCSGSQQVEFPFLCTNVKKEIAIWYEPYSDPAIDDDIKLYTAQFGPQSFYAKAPRIRDWDEFKLKLIEMEGKQSQFNDPKPVTKEREIIPRYIETNCDSLSTVKSYPKFLSHIQKNSNRLLYSIFPVLAFIGFLLIANGKLDSLKDNFFPITGIFLLFSTILYIVLTVINIAILKAKPWRDRSKTFRVWCFSSGCWFVGIPVIKVFSEDGFPDIGSDRFIHMLLIMIVPPALIGLATYIYQKYVK